MAATVNDSVLADVGSMLNHASNSVDQISNTSPSTIVKIDSVQFNPPSILASPDASSEGSTSSSRYGRSTDSGYVSVVSSNTSTALNFDDEAYSSRKRLFPGNRRKLQPYNKEVPQSTWNRFIDLNEIYGKPLLEFLSKGRKKFGPISTKLKVLGEDEATAKPWVLVQCDESVSKKIREFYNQPHVRVDYQPCDPESDLPSFEIIVCSRPPRPMAANSLEIYGYWTDQATLETLCGQLIKVCEHNDNQFATLGGIIKVVMSKDDIRFYGLTARHAFEKDNFDDDGIDSDQDEEDEDGQVFLDEEVFELDHFNKEPDREIETGYVNSSPLPGIESSTEPEKSWSKIGHTAMLSGKYLEKRGNLDWALIEIDDPSLYRPNLVSIVRQNYQQNLEIHLEEFSHEPVLELSRPVMLLSGLGGSKLGNLSTYPSFLRIAPGGEFIKTYSLSLTDGSKLKAGDCGSWVIDSATFQVYGHVVASDVLNEVYVVSLRAIFWQIQEYFGAESVQLPTSEDAQVWRELRLRENSTKQKSIASNYGQGKTSTFTTSNAYLADRRMSSFSNYRLDFAILEAAGGRIPSIQHNPPTGASPNQITPWMSSNGSSLATFRNLTSFHNDSSDNLSQGSQLSPSLRPSTGRTGNTSDKSSVTTANSTGSKSSVVRPNAHKSLKNFFGDDFQGKDASDTCLPGHANGKEHRSNSLTRHRNHTTSTETGPREGSLAPPRPRTPVPSSDVVPFLYQDSQDISLYDRERYITDNFSQAPLRSFRGPRMSYDWSKLPKLPSPPSTPPNRRSQPTDSEPPSVSSCFSEYDVSTKFSSVASHFGLSALPSSETVHINEAQNTTKGPDLLGADTVGSNRVYEPNDSTHPSHTSKSSTSWRERWHSVRRKLKGALSSLVNRENPQPQKTLSVSGLLSSRANWENTQRQPTLSGASQTPAARWSHELTASKSVGWDSGYVTANPTPLQIPQRYEPSIKRFPFY